MLPCATASCASQRTRPARPDDDVAKARARSGVGDHRAMSAATVSSFLNAAGRLGGWSAWRERVVGVTRPLAVSPHWYRSACHASRARSSCRVEEAGNPSRVQQARISRSGSANRRRRSARQLGSTAAVYRSTARPGEFVHVGVWAQVDCRRVAAPVELPDQPAHCRSQLTSSASWSAMVSRPQLRRSPRSLDPRGPPARGPQLTEHRGYGVQVGLTEKGDHVPIQIADPHGTGRARAAHGAQSC